MVRSKFWKSIEKVSRPKDYIFKTLCSYAKNYEHEVNISTKASKIVKNSPQIVKNEHLYWLFCHIEPTCQKICIYGEKCDFWLVRAPFSPLQEPP